MPEKQLSRLIDMDSPEAVLREVLTILELISPSHDFSLVTTVFNWTKELYYGDDERYQSCNTDYHDFHHITDTFLAMARLIHGAVIEGVTLDNDEITMGLISALAHDTGYLQEIDDIEGTGSKYTANHVQRSMDFIKKHGNEYVLNKKQVAACRAMILCTDLAADIPSISFPSSRVELLGKMLGSADLLAQMADRVYLEKLLFLYHEFREAHVGDYSSDLDLLQKTIRFYDFIAQRLENILDGTDRYMVSHMVSRWGIKENLYDIAIQNQKDYLQKIMDDPDLNPLDELRRRQIVDKVRKMYNEA